MSFLADILEEATVFVIKSARNTHKEGYFHIGVFVLLTILGYFIWNGLGTLFLVLTLWCISFFRNPHRVPPSEREDVVVASGDGIVSDISTCLAPSEITSHKEEMVKISIFLSVFDVHVNRLPVSCKIKQIVYMPGKFFNATLDKASKDNERNSLLLENKYDNKELIVVQIAGLLARRIVCSVDANTEKQIGQEFGLIKFGSRVDLYIPKSYNVQVKVGQRMIGGETVIALAA